MKKYDKIIRDTVREVVAKHFDGAKTRNREDIERERKNKFFKEERKQTIRMILSTPLLIAIIFVVGLSGIIGRILFEMVCLVMGRRV